jgi:hypothetical protein
MFELKLNNNTILLKWGTWAMCEFCKTYNISLENYFESLASAQKDLDKIIKLFYIGYKSACVSKKEDIIYNEIDVCDWIDEIGSIYVSEGQLVEYFKYILSTASINVNSTSKETEKKKASKN